MCILYIPRLHPQYALCLLHQTPATLAHNYSTVYAVNHYVAALASGPARI